jgi:hypothetical protein
MSYDKPKVTIDLDEYNDLIQKRDSSLDIDDVCNTLASVILESFRGNQGAVNLFTASDMATTHKKFKFEINYNQHDYRNPLTIKVIEKKA